MNLPLDPTVAELRVAGFDGLEVKCALCWRTVRILWGRFRRPEDTTFSELGWALRCRDCNRKIDPSDMHIYQAEAPPAE
jgi:hypothetical protein